jgi:hypothetical protein
MSSSWTSRSGFHICFITRLRLRLALSHSLTQQVLPPHSLNLKDMVSPPPTPKGHYLGAFWDWSDSTSASWGRPEFEPGFLPVCWARLPGWFPGLSRFLCATGTHLLGSPGERLPLLDQHSLVVPGRGSPPGGLGTLSQQQGGENTILQIPDGPSEMLQGGSRRRWARMKEGWIWCCCRRAQTEAERAPRLLGSKFIKQARSDSADSCPKPEHWEQKGLSLYTI